MVTSNQGLAVAAIYIHIQLIKKLEDIHHTFTKGLPRIALDILLTRDIYKFKEIIVIVEYHDLENFCMICNNKLCIDIYLQKIDILTFLSMQQVLNSTIIDNMPWRIISCLLVGTSCIQSVDKRASKFQYPFGQRSHWWKKSASKA